MVENTRHWLNVRGTIKLSIWWIKKVIAWIILGPKALINQGPVVPNSQDRVC